MNFTIDLREFHNMMHEAKIDYIFVDDIYYTKHEVSSADTNPYFLKRLEMARGAMDDFWLFDGLFIKLIGFDDSFVAHCKILRKDVDGFSRISLINSDFDDYFSLENLVREVKKHCFKG